MVDWQSPAEIAKNGASFKNLMHTLIGLYMWEWVVSLPFDWQYITGKKRFRWPVGFYFAGRYSLLFALIGIAIALNVTEPVNCQALYTYNQLFGNATIGFASINLSLRTMAVWSMSWYIIVPLVLISLAHWSLLLHGILLTASWIDGQGCVITNTNNTLLAATFIYTMCFDFLVLLLTAFKLGINGTQRKNRSRIARLIIDDGLIFFIIAFGANVIATCFMLLNLNAVMSIIANVPAAVVSTIGSCRVVRRLTNYTTAGAEVFGTPHASTPLSYSGRTNTRAMVSENKVDGVHVQMDTFHATGGAALPPDLSVYTYDAAARKVHRSDIETFIQDPEARPADEYKAPSLP